MSGQLAWATVLIGSGLVLAIKLAGYALPHSWFTGPRLAPVVALVTVALLAGLMAVQTLANGTALVIDARLPALAVAALALWRKAPFIVVVILAAATAAALRALGWCQ